MLKNGNSSKKKMARSKPIITVNKLTKSFTGYERGAGFLESLKSIFWRKTIKTVAVKNVNFTIKKGEIVGFLGPNGAGKSTTIKMLSGILYPSSGEVDVMGFCPWKERGQYVQHISTVFGQKSQLEWDLPPIDAFYLNKAIFSVSDQDFEETLKYMSEALGVSDVMKRPTRNLSLGERMKCEFIMAMLHKPPVVFLDEPTIGLDVFAKESIRNFILEWNRTHKTTFILTTHDLDDIAHLAHRVIVINHGSVVFDDTMEVLRKELGERKLIHITTRKPLPALKRPGILVRHLISPYEADITLDTRTAPIDEFLRLVRLKNEILDVVIQEPPIEEIIRKIYRQGKG